MYVVEGRLTVRTNPELFLGKFGIFHQGPTYVLGQSGTKTLWYAGKEKWAHKYADFMHRRGHIPPQAQVEEINTIEQAQKYARPRDISVEKTSFTEPDLIKLLTAKVPDDTELLTGSAQLWQEQRKPTPWIYLYASGTLLANMGYNPAEGWREQTQENGSEDFRVVKGLLTPILKIELQ